MGRTRSLSIILTILVACSGSDEAPLVISVLMRTAAGDLTTLPSQDVALYRAELHIVGNRPLRVEKLIEYACACGAYICEQYPLTVPTTDCSSCGAGELSPIDVSGRCHDGDGDGRADRFLVSALVELDCPEISTFGLFGKLLSEAGEVYPLEDQGGTAIAFSPAVPLPASTACSVRLTPRFTEHDGSPLSPVIGTFTTAPIAVGLDTPPKVGDRSISLRFSTEMNPHRVNAVAVTRARDGGRVEGTYATTSTTDYSRVYVTFPDPLEASDYVVTVPAEVTDVYGQQASDPLTVGFTAAP